MISYVTIGARDMTEARGFYDPVLAVLGYGPQADYGRYVGYGPEKDRPEVWICEPYDGQAARAGNGVMVAFGSQDHARVDAFYAAALQAGGACEGPPGPREAYGPDWYCAYVRDPTGNKLAIVCNTPQ